MITEKNVCVQIVKNGYFVDFDVEGKKQKSGAIAHKAEAVPVSATASKSSDETEIKMRALEHQDAPQSRFFARQSMVPTPSNTSGAQGQKL